MRNPQSVYFDTTSYNQRKQDYEVVSKIYSQLEQPEPLSSADQLFSPAAEE